MDIVTELKKKMINVIGSSSNPLIESIAERCTNVALLFCLGQSQGLVKYAIPSLSSIEFKKLRKAKKLTLRDVESITGISNSYLSQLETGKIKNPGYDTVKILYDLYSTET